MLTKSKRYPILDLLRWVAAAAVCEGHLRNLLLADFSQTHSKSVFTSVLYFITGFGEPAVVVFFVISGFLVGGRVYDLIGEGPKGIDLERFVIDRFSRIFIVAWPATLVSFVIFLLLRWLGSDLTIMQSPHWSSGWPGVLRDGNTASEWIAVIFLLNQFITKTIPINGVLWSLAYEWFFYLISFFVVSLFAPAALKLRIFLLAIILALFFFDNLEGRTALQFLPIWILGLVAYILNKKVSTFKYSTRWMPLLAFCVGLIAWRLHSFDEIYVGVLSAVLCSYASTYQTHQKSLFSAASTRLADFSFSLYCLHAPIVIGALALLQSKGMFLERAIPSVESLGLYLLLSITVYSSAYLFSLVTERKTRILRNGLISLLSQRARPCANEVVGRGLSTRERR